MKIKITEKQPVNPNNSWYLTKVNLQKQLKLTVNQLFKKFWHPYPLVPLWGEGGGEDRHICVHWLFCKKFNMLTTFTFKFFSIERRILEIPVKEWKFSQFLHKQPCKIRNTYGGTIWQDKYLNIFWAPKFHTLVIEGRCLGVANYGAPLPLEVRGHLWQHLHWLRRRGRRLPSLFSSPCLWWSMMAQVILNSLGPTFCSKKKIKGHQNCENV